MQLAIFLRGINTGKLKLLKSDFVAILQASGYYAITTIQAAGTAVCSVERAEEQSALARLQQALNTTYGKPIAIFTLEKARVEAIVDHAEKRARADHLQCYMMLIKESALYDQAVAAHRTIDYLPGETLENGNGYFLWTIPKGHTLGDFGKKVLGKKPFKENLTSRNVNTVKKVLQAMA